MTKHELDAFDSLLDANLLIGYISEHFEFKEDMNDGSPDSKLLDYVWHAWNTFGMFAIFNMQLNQMIMNYMHIVFFQMSDILFCVDNARY